MSRLAYDLRDIHTHAWDTTVLFTPLNPGTPVLVIGADVISHFGAVLTVLPDSSLLVLRTIDNHPLGLQPGDIVLGYEGVAWKDLVDELLGSVIPILSIQRNSKSSVRYNELASAGMNWHLFETIDIVKYASGDTVHLPVYPLLNLVVPTGNVFFGPKFLMCNNEQLPVPGVPFPDPNEIPERTVFYGIVEGTNIGYIYSYIETDNTDDQFYEAVTSLYGTEGLIIDLRLNFGGGPIPFKGLNLLFNARQLTLEDAIRCNQTDFSLCPVNDQKTYLITGNPMSWYDRPLAVLTGPNCVSMGDRLAYMFIYHPMAQFFGKSTCAALSYSTDGGIGTFPGWNFWYSNQDAFLVNDPEIPLNRREFPVDDSVWFDKEGVAKGEDAVVKKAIEWINNLVYGHNVTTDKWWYSAGNDTVTIKAIIENPKSHQISAKLFFESLDGSFIDSVNMTEITLPEGNQWQGKWITPGPVENTYWISLKVTDISKGTYFTSKHSTRITTAGPVVLDSISCAKMSSIYYVKTFLRNKSINTTIKNASVKLICNDSWVNLVSLNAKNLPNIPPGGVVSNSSLFYVRYIDSLFPGYFNFKLEISSDGWPYWTDSTHVIVTGVKMEDLQTLTFNLEQNYPNPFYPVTTINWQLPKGNRVTIKVYDIGGREVATLIDTYRSAGKYDTEFNATSLPEGVYFYQIKAGEFIQTKKMIVLK